MSTHYEWLAPRVRLVPEGTEVGEHLTEAPALIIGDHGQSGVIQGSYAELGALAVEILTALREASDPQWNRDELTERISELELEAQGRFMDTQESVSWGELADLRHVDYLDPDDAEELVRLRKIEAELIPGVG